MVHHVVSPMSINVCLQATVACRQLGFAHAVDSVKGHSYVYRSFMVRTAVVARLSCRGDEETLQECQHDESPGNNCRYSDYAAVLCSSKGWMQLQTGKWPAYPTNIASVNLVMGCSKVFISLIWR